MFIGHFALGLAAKRRAPATPLVVLFAAAQLADLLWPIFLIVGFEEVRIDPGNTAFTPLDFISYPYSHSLFLLLVWAVIFGLVFTRAPRRAAGTATVLAALVVSHWVLDAITHRADMPLYPEGPKVGLGLWNSVPATMIVEGAMYAVGLWIYAGCTRARDGIGRWGFWSFAAFLVVAYLVNVFGPPPPSVQALQSTAAIGAAILLVWSWWFDRHREPDTGP